MAAARIKDWTISSTKYDALKYHSGSENLKTGFFSRSTWNEKESWSLITSKEIGAF